MLSPDDPKDADHIELEATIKRLVDRLDEVREGSAEHRMIIRQLVGLRDFSEVGGLIIQDYEMIARLALP
jgi:hypothetical protein